MRTLKLYRHGCTIGTPPRKNDHDREKRGEVTGWSEAATRRNTAFLRSIFEPDLHSTSTGEPLSAYAVTLTLKSCPPSSDDWHRLRNALYRRYKRLGLYRSHWVTEWQRRGVPHLHGAFWLPPECSPSDLIRHWCELASDYGALPNGQHIAPISDAIGWFKYLSKHASRGVSHYQRNPDNIPPAWQKKTGRVWGKTGDWPITEPVQFQMDDKAFFQYRRLLKRWRIADSRSTACEAVELACRRSPLLRQLPFPVQARAARAYRRLVSARRMLKSSDIRLSSVRGASEWVPDEMQLLALDWLRAQGCDVYC